MPKPCDAGQGWETNVSGVLEPVWTCGPILSPSLIDILKETSDEIENEEIEEIEDIDFDEFFEEDDDGNSASNF